jgi:oligoribonuclease NrnB/cAMP/cGMP phosphodiesterase (DHH superfamily)
MKCFYHNDADGRCSGFWVHLSVGINDQYIDHSFIEMSYAKPFPMESIRKDEQIYIVDYSISPDEMRQLLKITKNVTWIDHHKTAIEKYKDFEYKIRGIRYDGVAGCMLTYCYIYHMTQRGTGDIKPFDPSMTKDAPRFTKLIADWDVWKFEYGDDTRHFITAFNAYDFWPSSRLWDGFLSSDDFTCSEFIKNGITMNAFRDGWARDYMNLGFESEFEGVKCFAVNLGRCNSEYFKSLPVGKYDVLMPFVFDGNQYTVSLYSTTIDVSEIAKKHGGGGHKGASGFQCKELPFKKR